MIGNSTTTGATVHVVVACFATPHATVVFIVGAFVWAVSFAFIAPHYMSLSISGHTFTAYRDSISAKMVLYPLVCSSQAMMELPSEGHVIRCVAWSSHLMRS